MDYPGGGKKQMRVTEDASTHGLKFDVDDMTQKTASQDQTKILHIKQKLATIDHTPDHPVYPVMIQEAIEDLNEGGGSTKDAISQFIMRKYDVFRVVHTAKLIEQLEKLVEKEEIVCTSENRYMLPAEDTGSPANLKQGKKQSVQCQQDWRSNELHKVKERVGILEDQDSIIAKEDQTEIDKEREPQAVQSEHVECQNHLQDQVRIYEEERFKMNAEKISQVVEGQSKVIEEERYQQPAKGVDEGLHDKQTHIQSSETEATEEQTQLQRQEVQVTEDEVEAESESKVTEDLHNVEHPESEEIKDETQPQVPKDLQVEVLRLEKTHKTTSGMQIEAQVKEVEVNGEQKALQEQDNEVGNNPTEISISHTLELYTEKSDQDKAMISMPSSSQTSQQLDHAGTSLLLYTMKEKCINAWKKLTEAEHELVGVFSCLNSMKVLVNRESEPKALPQSDYVPTDSMQLAQNQQIELPKLKRTAEVEITALRESFQTQKRQAFPGNHEGALKHQPESICFSPALLNMDSQRHKAEKHQDFPGYKGHLELCGPEKLYKSCLVAGSSKAYMEAQELNLEQQSEHHRTIVEDLQIPVNLDHVNLEQQTDIPGLKVALEKNSTIVEEELTPTEDIITDTDQFEPERPPGFELTMEQIPQKRLQCAFPCGDAKKVDSMLPKEQKLEGTIKERSIEVEMTNSEQQCQIKQQMQGKELRPQDQRASKSKSGAAGETYDQQLHNTKMLQDPNQILVLDESSLSMNQQKKGPGKRKKVKMELPRRELRPRGSKASSSNPAHSAYANDLDQTLSSINLDRQQKLDHQIPERPQEKKPKKVDKSSQSLEQELKDRGKKKHLRSQLAPITSDEVQMLESPGQYEPKTAGEFIQAQQQQQPRVQCPSQAEQTMDKTTEETPPLPNQNEQESQLSYQHRGRPLNLNPDMEAAEGKILSVDDQDHHKELPSHIEGQRPKTKTGTELIVGELSSSHPTRVEQQPKKRGRGRPPKLISAAPQTVRIPLPPLDQLQPKMRQHDHQQKQKWPNGEVKGGLQDPTRHRLQKLAISSLPSQNQKQQQHTPHVKKRSLRSTKVMVKTKGKASKI